MLMPFETFNVDVNCLGNHELDNGIEAAVELMKQTSSPWLMTNLTDKSSGSPIAGCKDNAILER